MDQQLAYLSQLKQMTEIYQFMVKLCWLKAITEAAATPAGMQVVRATQEQLPKEKSASGAKKLAPIPHQEKPACKSLSRLRKFEVSRMFTSEPLIYGDDLISQTNAQGVHTFGYDGLGSTRILTDINGVVQNSYGYQAFGELDYQYGAIENNYLFTGEQYDNNVGFYYLRARFYNPSIGRFQNMDVFPGMQFEPVTLHKYKYANGDPISFVDPTGYFSIGSFAAAQRVSGIMARYAVGILALDVGLHGATSGKTHRYEFKRKVCSLSNPICTKKTVFNALRYFPAPVTNITFATDNTLSLLWGLPGQANYVTHKINATGFSLLNITEPSHIFHKGKVERKVISEGGYLQIHTVGDGVNSTILLSYLNVRLSQGVFAWADARIKAAVLSGVVGEDEPFELENNFCGLGVFCY